MALEGEDCTPLTLTCILIRRLLATPSPTSYLIQSPAPSLPHKTYACAYELRARSALNSIGSDFHVHVSGRTA